MKSGMRPDKNIYNRVMRSLSRFAGLRSVFRRIMEIIGLSKAYPLVTIKYRGLASIVLHKDHYKYELYNS